MRLKINSKAKRIVLREANKNPYLGVRGIAKICKQNYQIGISKSAIGNIIKSKIGTQKKGRKEYALAYKSRAIQDCGLFLLKAIDCQLNLFSVLAEELKPYFPRLDLKWIKKLLLLVSFSSYAGGGIGITKNAKRQGFLRLADCYHYPARKINYFLSRIYNYKPAVSLEKVEENAQTVSTVKFYFANHQVSYSDAKLKTFWDSPCKVKDFFSTVYYVNKRLSYLEKEKIIMINYTKSFDYLSPLVLNFINGISKGIRKIELINPAGRVLQSKLYEASKLSFLIGYYPKIISKGLFLLEKEKKFQKLNNLEIYYTAILTRFLQPKEPQGVILNNILIKTRKAVLPSWGLITDRRSGIGEFLQKYLYLWPNMENTLLEDMKLLEIFFLSKEEKKDFEQCIPKTFSIEKEEDASRLVEILHSIFKEQFADMEFRGNAGTLTMAKNSCSITLKNIPSQVKKNFNNSCLYLDNKRLLIV